LAHGVVEIDLPDRSAALIWIIQNQFGRRNLTPFVRAELALRLEPLIAAQSQQGRRSDLCPKSDKSSKPLDTKKEVAKAADMKERTLAKAPSISARIGIW